MSNEQEQRNETPAKYDLQKAPSLILHPVQRPRVTVYGFGRNDFFQLGASESDSSSEHSSVATPQPIAALAGKDVTHIAANIYSSVVTTADGEVFVFGSNEPEPSVGSAEPRRVTALDIHRIISAACGQNHIVAVTDTGLLASFGADEFGQLGQGPDHRTHQPNPRIIKTKLPQKSPFVRTAAGAAHTLALNASGQVYAFGHGTFGALGQGDEENADIPRRVWGLWNAGVVQIACGDNHSAALSADGRVFTWGRGRYGALGGGDFNNRSTPRHVPVSGGRVQQLAAGGDHTLLLTTDGEVFSFGRGTWGATGLGSTDNTCRPGRVQGLEGAHVLQITAGSRHSAVLTSTNEVFTWGAGLHLGRSADVLTPTRVRGLPPLPIKYISAGGDHTFVVVAEAAPGQQVAIGPSPSEPHGQALLPLQLPSFLALTRAAAAAAAQEDGGAGRDRAVAAVVHAVESVFSCQGYLLAGFSLPQQDADEAVADATVRPASPSPAAGDMAVPHQLDLGAVGAVYESLLKLYRPEVVASLSVAVMRLLKEADIYHNKMRAAPSADWVRLLLLLLLNPVNSEGSGAGSQLIMRIAGATSTLPRTLATLLSTWLGGLPPDVLGGRVVRSITRTITQRAQHDALQRNRGDVLLALQLLELAWVASGNEDAAPAQLRLSSSSSSGPLVPYQQFYIAAFGSSANLRAEYLLWLGEGVHSRRALNDPIVSLCQVPWAMTADAKSRILQGEASLQKQQHQQNSAMAALASGLDAALIGSVTHLDIRVRREQLLHDSLEQILRRPEDLKKPLHVTFISQGVAEEGMDQGGVSREFYQLLVAEIFRPEYGMFTYDEETRDFWFRASPLETAVEFQLVGTVLGLAIYNGVILNVHFPLVIYKKLTGQKPTFKDLADTMPSLARGLRQLLEFEGDVESTFMRTFEVEYEFFGTMLSHELKPGGKSVPVTNANREEYVRLYTDWLLNTSIEPQFNAFQLGFQQVVGGPALSLFQHHELELLICGLPHLDFAELQKHAKYEGGYSPEHLTVQAFWQVLHALPLEQKKKFLFFTTGCDRAPVGGLQQLTLVIQRSADSDRLPSAHTCFNTLLLPDYGSAEKLRTKLLIAIQNAQGFGLQ